MPITVIHRGAAACREDCDFLSRPEATRANAMGQAEQRPWDVWLPDEAGKLARASLLTIEGDDTVDSVSSQQSPVRQRSPFATAGRPVASPAPSPPMVRHTSHHIYV